MARLARLRRTSRRRGRDACCARCGSSPERRAGLEADAAELGRKIALARLLDRPQEAVRRRYAERPQQGCARRRELGAALVAALRIVNVEDELDDLDPIDGAALGEEVEAGEEAGIAGPGNDHRVGNAFEGEEVGAFEALAVAPPRADPEALAVERTAHRFRRAESRQRL